MAEGQGDNNAGGAVERVTITQAATVLGCHRNTIKNRIQAGMYRAEKIHTENGLTWMIDRNSLTNNTPPTARQQPVGGVSVAQQEAIQELARAIVREAGIAQDPEAQARLEGNKLAAEAAKTQVLVGSGLLVGMAAVVSVMPKTSIASPLIYISFALVVFSILLAIVWMRDIARITLSSEGNAMRQPPGSLAAVSFIFGLALFCFYVLWNSPGDEAGSWIFSPDTPSEQSRWLLGFLVLMGIVGFVGYVARRWREQRRS